MKKTIIITSLVLASMLSMVSTPAMASAHIHRGYALHWNPGGL